MISKETFVEVIGAIEKQHAKDMLNSIAIDTVFGGESYLYDNSLLSKSVIKLLQLHFPREDGFCEIEHFCYFLNFGKLGDEITTADQLWDKLNSI